MASGTVHVRLRPVKLAFLVDPADKNAVLEAIQTNSFLWGGLYNPIIPFFQRRPKFWREGLGRQPSAVDVLNGYLEAFDPDFVVPLGRCIGRKPDVGHRSVVNAGELLKGAREEGAPAYGVGLFEILTHVIYEELRFLRKRPINIRLPSWGKRYGCFFASVFGSLSPILEDRFKSEFANAIGAKEERCTILNYADFMSLDNWFLRRMTNSYLKTTPNWPPWLGQFVFLMDATRTIDVIDYWNLRALGCSILPMPIQSQGSPATIALAADFANRCHVRDRMNPSIMYAATLLKSRCVKKEAIDRLIASSDDLKGKLHIQDRLPSMWDRELRADEIRQGCNVKADTKEVDLSEGSGQMRFGTLDPKFAAALTIYGKARFANEIDFRFYGTSDEPLAEVIPEGHGRLAKAFGTYGLADWRFSRSGPVFLSGYTNWRIYLNRPKAESVFHEWFSAHGWEVKPSSAGLIARNVLKRVGGVSGASSLANSELMAFLSKVKPDCSISAEAFWGEMCRIAQDESSRKDPKSIGNWLTNIEMFRLGLEIQCPSCTRHSWYSTKEFDSEIRCPKCLEMFPTRNLSPKELSWAYRLTGPFALPSNAEGVYSVLLTLRFFSQSMDAATCPMLSFTANKGTNEVEVDLGLLFRDSRDRAFETLLVLAECKSYNKFERKDIARAKALACDFPGAVLVFATLRREFTGTEKRLIVPLVERERRQRLRGKACNRILLLTGNELLAEWRLPEWLQKKILPGLYDSRLSQCCDLTQQRYLGMNSWYDWLNQKYTSKRSSAPGKGPSLDSGGKAAPQFPSDPQQSP